MKLEAKGVNRAFFRDGKGTNIFYAVEKTDFSLPEGRLTCIVGRSGSGKTTFSNIISGLLQPTEGTVLIDGKDIYEMDDVERSKFRNKHIGMIPQGQTGLQSLTVLENVLLPISMYGDASEAKPAAVELLKLLEIDDLSEVYSNELSGGELRRMAIARALVGRPEIVIADEPTGDLDDETTEMVLKLFKERAEQGTSILMITHEQDALAYADQVYRMEKGRLGDIEQKSS